MCLEKSSLRFYNRKEKIEWKITDSKAIRAKCFRFRSKNKLALSSKIPILIFQFLHPNRPFVSSSPVENNGRSKERHLVPLLRHIEQISAAIEDNKRAKRIRQGRITIRLPWIEIAGPDSW